MTELEKQMAEALRKAYEALMLSRPGSENNEPTEEEWQAHFEARRTARDALAKFDAQAAMLAAGVMAIAGYAQGLTDARKP